MSTAPDDLLAGSANGLVSVHAIFGAWRRSRRLIAMIAVAGMVAGLLLALRAPHRRSATTSVLLQYPSGIDPAQAVQTDLSLLQTRAVGGAAEKALGLHEPAATFAASFHGKALSDSVLEISARGSSAGEAVRRANALAVAFLHFRKQTYEYQLGVVQALLHQREQAVEDELAATNRQIATAGNDPNRASAPGAPTLGDLLTQRAAQQNDIDDIENQIQSNILATTTVVDGSHVIDAGAPVVFSMPRTAAVDAVTGLVAGLAIALGGVTLAAVVSNRPIRRADVAAALEAPVVVSVGRLPRPARRRKTARRRRASRRGAPPDDMTLVVRHLVGLLKSATTEPPALVVVAVGDLSVAVAAVDALTHKLADEGFELTVVNETGGRLTKSGIDTSADRTRRDGDVVLAVLAPARGAEHLREWANDAVVIVTAGRASTTTLRSNATMIRSAGLKLRSVVLVGSDPNDETLGAFVSPAPDDRDSHPAGAAHRAPTTRVP